MYFTKYENAKRLNPSSATGILDSQKIKNKLKCIETLNEKHPKFLHKCYRQAIKLHGLAENIATICTSMECHARVTYPSDDIQGQ